MASYDASVGNCGRDLPHLDVMGLRLPFRIAADGWLYVASGMAAYGGAGVYCVIVSDHTLFGMLLMVTACASGIAHYVGWLGVWGVIDRALAWPMFAWYVGLVCRSSSIHVHAAVPSAQVVARS